MDKDRVKGTIDEVVGSTKRHIGNLTGDTDTEAEGAVQQVKGKLENTVGKIKDAARDAASNLKTAHDQKVVNDLDDRELAHRP